MLTRSGKYESISAKHRLNEPVYVVRTKLPDFDMVSEHLRSIWDRGWVTNNGKVHGAFEKALESFLGGGHVSLTCNGTLALMIAIRALGLKGEVVTTPFTFPATVSALDWCGIRPVFCDIAPGNFNIDPSRIEECVTPATTAVLGVHVYGNPCDVDGIGAVADRHGLKVLYDAAHAFGVNFRGKPMVSFGDVSALSFHATKLFHTFEGGALATPDPELKRRADHLKNFGIADEETVLLSGINAKMNEFQAALGLLGLDLVQDEIEKRKGLFLKYTSHLSGQPGITCPAPDGETDYNYMYYPVVIDAETAGFSRNDLYEALRACNIFARKYFYPLVSNYPFYAALESSAPERLPHATRTADAVLCLPLYGDLDPGSLEAVCCIIKEMSRSA